MVWNTPVLVEVCIGLEINGYLRAEFWLRRFASARRSRSNTSGIQWLLCPT